MSSLGAPVWIGLLYDDGREVQAKEYRRVQAFMERKTNGEGDIVTNFGSTLVFPTAETAWGAITYFGLYAKEDDEHPLVMGSLNGSLNVGMGDTAQIETLTADRNATDNIMATAQAVREVDTTMNNDQREQLRGKAARARQALRVLEDDE